MEEQGPGPAPEPAAPVIPVAPARPAVVGPAYNVRLVLAIWFVTGVIDAMIGIRFLLKLLGASTASAFTTFIYGLTDLLVAPFRGIFPESAHQFYVFEPAALVAIVIYALIGWALVALVRILSAPRRPRAAIE